MTGDNINLPRTKRVALFVGLLLAIVPAAVGFVLTLPLVWLVDVADDWISDEQERQQGRAA